MFPLTRLVLLSAIISLSLGHPAGASAQTAPVPPSFQGVYTSLNGYLGALDSTLGSNPPSTSVLYSAALVRANANAGPSMLNSGYFTGVQEQIQSLKAMGMQAAMVEVGFPMLYPPFFQSQSQYQKYVNFYAQVAAAVRAAGMKLIVENDALWPSSDCSSGWNTTPFYQTLNWTEYQQARAQTAEVIAQTMRPDYLVVFEEPATEANSSGQTVVNTPAGATSLVAGLIAGARQAGVAGMQIGAGVANYQPNFAAFIHSFVALPLDFIDMHVYRANRGELLNAVTIAGIAHTAGLPVTMSESWLNKVGDSELGTVTTDQIRGRDPFSFWAPLDTEFIQSMVQLAGYTQMRFLTIFGSHYMWAYLPYNSSTMSMPPAQILTLESQQAQQAVLQGAYTAGGLAYAQLATAPADVVPPSTPLNVIGMSSSTTTATVKYAASTDNVGVAGYFVFRNGVKVGSTLLTAYQDTGLTPATTYSYTIQAFDVAGNVSAPSLTAHATTLR